MINMSHYEHLRIDLKNFAKTYCNCIVDNISAFVNEFNQKYPGYLKDLGIETILYNAEKLSERGWK